MPRFTVRSEFGWGKWRALFLDEDGWCRFAGYGDTQEEALARAFGEAASYYRGEEG